MEKGFMVHGSWLWFFGLELLAWLEWLCDFLCQDRL
jgi:hypothetical protein